MAAAAFADRLDPELRAAFDALSSDDGWVEPFEISAIRERYARRVDAAQAPAAAEVAQREMAIGGPDGARLRLRVYEPRSRKRSLPAVLYVHGGGFVVGRVEHFDAKCERCVSRTGAVVVSVDYRLAPEHPYPAAPEDCYAALVWMSEHALELGIEATRIATLGESAGGAIAATVALLSRERRGPTLALQALVGACLDDRHETASSCEIVEPRVWNTRKSMLAWRAYLGALADGEVPEHAAPARAYDLAGLAPAHIIVGGLDPMRDENIEYARRLMVAGVPTELHVYPSAYHGFDSAVPPAAVSLAALDGLFAALRAALDGGYSGAAESARTARRHTCSPQTTTS
jgi:acetyl esterase/lipase